MARSRRVSMSRWAFALLTGLTAAAAIAAILRLATGLDFELSVLIGGSIGLVLALLVARWFAAAGAVMSAVEAAVSGLALVVTILAAIVGALS